MLSCYHFDGFIPGITLMSSRVRIFWVWLEGQFWKLRMTLPASLVWKICSLPWIVIISCHTCLCFMSWVLGKAWYLDDLLLFVKLWLEFSCSSIDLLNQDSILYIGFLCLGKMRYCWLRISFSLAGLPHGQESQERSNKAFPRWAGKVALEDQYFLNTAGYSVFEQT